MLCVMLWLHPMSMDRLRILALYWHGGDAPMSSSVHRHLHCLDGQGSNVVYVNTAAPVTRAVRLQRWAGIMLHTTFLTGRWHQGFYTWKRQFEWLSGFDAPKVALPQDEYDHSQILDEWLYELGVTVIFTNFPPQQRQMLYPVMSRTAAFEECFTGYVDPKAVATHRSSAPLASRPLDVAYRAQNLPYWFGSHGQLKHRIAVAATEAASALGMSYDISTEQSRTVLGPAWFDFLASARATVGVESGSSVLDRRGAIQSMIRRRLIDHPSATFASIDAQMPAGWDDYRFYAIGPRHLEAATTRTAQILVEGEYGGVLEAGRHYIPVQRDLGNLPEALESMRNTDLLQTMVDRTYDEVACNELLTYPAFGRRVHEYLGVNGPRAWLPQKGLNDAAVSVDDSLRRAVWNTERVLARRLSAWHFRRPSLRTTVAELRFNSLSFAAATRLVAGTPEVRRLAIAATRSGVAVAPAALIRDVLDLRTFQNARAWDTDASPKVSLVAENVIVLHMRRSHPTDESTEAVAAIRAGRVGAIKIAGEDGTARTLALLSKLAPLFPEEAGDVLDHFVSGGTRDAGRWLSK
jgi:hypothetical protein